MCLGEEGIDMIVMNLMQSVKRSEEYINEVGR